MGADPDWPESHSGRMGWGVSSSWVAGDFSAGMWSLAFVLREPRALGQSPNSLRRLFPPEHILSTCQGWDLGSTYFCLAFCCCLDFLLCQDEGQCWGSGPHVALGAPATALPAAQSRSCTETPATPAYPKRSASAVAHRMAPDPSTVPPWSVPHSPGTALQNLPATDAPHTQHPQPRLGSPRVMDLEVPPR